MASRWPKIAQAGPKGSQDNPRCSKLGQSWPRLLQISTHESLNSPNMAQRCPKMVPRWSKMAVSGCLGFDSGAPWLCLRFAFALPSRCLCLCFAFALLLYCLCFAFPFPFPFEWGVSPKLSTKQEPTTIDTNTQVDDRKHVGEA